MVDVRAPLPNFPRPPEKGYDSRYFHDLVRALEQMVFTLRNPGEGRHTKMVFTDLNDDQFGVEVGSLYHPDDGLVHIKHNITNLLTKTEDISHGNWTKVNVTITPNDTTAPDGTTTADKILE